MKKLIVFLGVASILPGLNVLQAQQPFHILKTFHIQSPGSWDYISIGPGNNRLYVSHGTQVNILDLVTGDSVGVIENTTGVHGIAFDPSQNKGFTSNGRINNVTVFDLTSNAVITQIATGGNPDAIFYESYSKRIVTCNGRGKNLSFIDPVSNKLVDSIAVGGKPETAVSDGKGKLFVNIEDKNEIVMVNLKTMKVEGHWPLTHAEEPAGLAFDRASNRLFAGCGNKLLAVVDATTGKVLQELPIGDGCDGSAFDPATKNVFASNGDGSLSVYHENASGMLELLANAPTKRGARTIAVDEKSHLVYLPTADFEAADPAAPNARPKTKPGTFQVLVIGQ